MNLLSQLPPSLLILSLFLFAAPVFGAAPSPVVLKAEKDLNFGALFSRTNGWVAGDGAISVPLPDGRSLWLFGDSHIDDFDPATASIPCLFQARNAAFLFDGHDFANVTTLVGRGRGFRSWYKNSTDENLWFWPMCGFEHNGIVHVYLSALKKAGHPGMWDFQSAGHDYWGKSKYPQLDTPVYSALPDFNGITFGHGFVLQDDFIYAFGSKPSGIASDIFVARFKPANPDTLWAFWDGHFWSPSPQSAKPIARGASTSLHICKIGDRFLLTTSAFSVACDQGKNILMATSSRPTGPFSPLKKVFTIDDLRDGHYPFFYFPVAHPEFINDKNELLVTYSINGYAPCLPPCENGRMKPDDYRPRAVRVPLKLVDIPP